MLWLMNLAVENLLFNIIYSLFDWQNCEIIEETDFRIETLSQENSAMKLVSQNYDLMPYLTVAENIGKFISNTNLSEKAKNSGAFLQVVGLFQITSAVFRQNLWWFQQLASCDCERACNAKTVLLDEPFSNLDYSRKWNWENVCLIMLKNMNFLWMISLRN